MEKEELCYLQIDFLRLFRLSKNLRYISRKRKMPSECNGDRSKVLRCCNDLLKVFIGKTFNTNYCIVRRSRSFTFEVRLPEVIFLKKFIHRELNDGIREKLNMVLRTDFIRANHDDWIYINPINFCSYGYVGYRPTVRFLQTALKILEYKKNMDEIIEILKEIELAENPIEQLPPTELPNPFIIDKANTFTATYKLNTEVSEQFKFNEALRKYIERQQNGTNT